VLDRASKAGAPSDAFCTPQKLRRGTNVTPLRARQLAVVAWDFRDWLDVGLEHDSVGWHLVHSPDEHAPGRHNGALEAFAREV